MLKPTLTSSLLAFLMGVGVAGWLATRRAPAAAVPAAKLPTNLLARRTGPMEFDRVPLRQAVDQLATRTRSSIVVDRQTLQNLNIDPEAAVRIGFGDVPLETAIQLLFGAPPSIGAWERDGVVHIDYADSPQVRKLSVRAHDISDLVAPLPAQGVDPLRERREMIDRVIVLIMENVEPGVWSHVSGDGEGSIRMLGDVMYIYLNERGQEQVGNLLAHLRAARSHGPIAPQPLRSGVDLLANPASIH